MGEIMATAQQGPIRATIEANRKAMSLFSQREQNTMIREAMRRVGDLWVRVFLPKRFTSYATSVLRYNPSAYWEDVKARLARRGVIAKPQPTPLVYTGISRNAALSGLRVDPKATKNRAYCVVRIPLGHAVQKQTSQVFKYLPRIEVARVADEFKKALVQGIADGFIAKSTAPRVGAAAAAPARASIRGGSRGR